MDLLRGRCARLYAVERLPDQRSTFVVLDTAPTGHTLLLLDATGSYHRDVARQMGDSGHCTTPFMRLQDHELTKVLIITLAETTPALGLGHQQFGGRGQPHQSVAA